MENQPNQTPNPVQQGGHPNVGMAVLAYFVFFIPLLTDSKNDPYVRYHVRQGFGFFLGWVATVVLDSAVYSSLFWSLISLVQLALVVLWFIGVANAVQGKQQGAPVVGPYFEKLKI